MTNEKKKKRYYKEGQVIWSIDLKKEVEVKLVDKDSLRITVLENKNGEIVEHIFPLWSVDVLKYKAKDKLKTSKANWNVGEYSLENSVKLINDIFNPKVYFAKVRDTAIIPSKRGEDAGYDIYADLKVVDGLVSLTCPANKTTLVPTGIAVALPSTHYLNVKHERGSTGKISMSVLSGVVDSGYRGEIFVAITPLDKTVVITNEVSETTVDGDKILYPYSKAIAQGTIDLVPNADITEITYEKLQTIESERGTTKLGQSGK